MKVDTAAGRDLQEFSREDETVCNHHCDFNFLCRHLLLHPLIQALRLDDAQSQGERLFFDCANAGASAPACRAIGLAEY